MIYQLAKTNTLLGGQQKLDVILGKNSDGVTTIKDFHLSPLSESIIFNYGQDEDALNYKHQDNIKRLYDKIEHNFYNDCLKSKLDTKYPIYTNNEYIDFENYDTEYICGLSRVPYDRYNKQLQYLCPIWITSISDIESLEFVVSIYKKSSNEKLITTNIELNNSNNSEYAKKFYNYIYNYCNDIELDDKLLYFNFTDKTARITGLDVKSGIYTNKDVSYIIPNMLSIERPVLDFDNMITRLFKESTMVCKQLFNFNLIFNIDDFIPNTYISEFIKGDYSISIDVQTYNTNVDKKDFYTNYDNIPSYSINSNGNIELNDTNALNYLGDNKYIEFIYKNKLVQNTTHWCLNENPSYIFNLYTGFNTVIDQKNNLYQKYIYGNTADIWTEKYNSQLNNIGWTYHLYTTTPDVILNSLSGDHSEFTEFKYNSAGSCWAEGLNYISSKGSDYTIKTAVYITDSNTYNDIPNQTGWDWFKSGSDLHIGSITDEDNKIYTIIFIINEESDCIDNFTFINVKNGKLTEYINQVTEGEFDDVLNTLCDDFIVNIKEPVFLYVDTTLDSYIVDSPYKFGYGKTDEIDYVKIENPLVFARYDGNIMPFFIDADFDHNIEEDNNIQKVAATTTTTTDGQTIVPSATAVTDTPMDCTECEIDQSSIYIGNDPATLNLSVDYRNRRGKIRIWCSYETTKIDLYFKNHGVTSDITTVLTPVTGATITCGSVTSTDGVIYIYPNNTAGKVTASIEFNDTFSDSSKTLYVYCEPVLLDDDNLTYKSHQYTTAKLGSIIVTSYGTTAIGTVNVLNNKYITSIAIQPEDEDGTLYTGSIQINTTNGSANGYGKLIYNGGNNDILDTNSFTFVNATLENVPDVSGITFVLDEDNTRLVISSPQSISFEGNVVVTILDGLGNIKTATAPLKITSEIVYYDSSMKFTVTPTVVSKGSTVTISIISSTGIYPTCRKFSSVTIANTDIVNLEGSQGYYSFDIIGVSAGTTSGSVVLHLYATDENTDIVDVTVNFNIKCIETDARYINNLYTVRVFNDIDSIRNYNNISFTKFEPNYPSINYCSIVNTELDYNKRPTISFEGSDEDVFIGENKWYNVSNIKYTYKEFTLTCRSTELTEDMIRSLFKEFYNLTSETEVDYYINKYKYKFDWEYASLKPVNGVFEYDYKIKFKLK